MDALMSRPRNVVPESPIQAMIDATNRADSNALLPLSIDATGDHLNDTKVLPTGAGTVPSRGLDVNSTPTR